MKKTGNICRRPFPGIFRHFPKLKAFTPLEKNFLTGFTLIEILLVVLLLGVVAGLAIPNFSQLYSNLQLSETTKNVAFLMRYAQGRAIIKKKLHRFEFDTVKNQCWLMQEADANAEKRDEGVDFQPISGKMGQSLSLPEGITLETDKPLILFYPDGKIDKARLYLHDSRNRYFTVSTQDQFGYVQIFEGKLE